MQVFVPLLPPRLFDMKALGDNFCNLVNWALSV